jgi:hypothetical protein
MSAKPVKVYTRIAHMVYIKNAAIANESETEPWQKQRYVWIVNKNFPLMSGDA